MARTDEGISAQARLALVLDNLKLELSQIEHGGVVIEYDARGEEVARRTPPLAEALRLLSLSARDGWRTSTRPGGTPTSIVDDEGVPMPPMSDPTGELATEAVKVHDPIRRHAQIALRALVDAQAHLQKAKSEMVQAFEEHDLEDGEVGCRVHAEAGYFEEPTRGDRCGWCYRFWLEHGDLDAPPELVRIKETKGKVSERQVKEALMAPRPRVRNRRGAA